MKKKNYFDKSCIMLKGGGTLLMQHAHLMLHCCIPSTTPPLKKHFFPKKQKKKCLECSEIRVYAKIFCDIFATVSMKNIFHDIFLRY